MASITKISDLGNYMISTSSVLGAGCNNIIIGEETEIYSNWCCEIIVDGNKYAIIMKSPSWLPKSNYSK